MLLANARLPCHRWRPNVYLSAVTSLSPADAWAVGYYTTMAEASQGSDGTLERQPLGARDRAQPARPASSPPGPCCFSGTAHAGCKWRPPIREPASAR